MFSCHHSGVSHPELDDEEDDWLMKNELKHGNLQNNLTAQKKSRSWVNRICLVAFDHGLCYSGYIDRWGSHSPALRISFIDDERR